MSSPLSRRAPMICPVSLCSTFQYGGLVTTSETESSSTNARSDTGWHGPTISKAALGGPEGGLLEVAARLPRRESSRLSRERLSGQGPDSLHHPLAWLAVGARSDAPHEPYEFANGNCIKLTTSTD